MICKFCNAQIDDERKVCPNCGEMLEEEILCEEAQPEAEELTAEETLDAAGEEAEVSGEENDEEEDDEDSYAGFTYTDVQVVEPKHTGRLVAGIIAAVLGLAGLALLLLVAMGVEIKLPTNDINRKERYTVIDEKAVKKGDAVVARMGDVKLTNAQLQMYYNMSVMSFLEQYGAYLSYFGFDYTKPMSEQAFDETMTWEQYFLQQAIETWQLYQGLCLMAEKAGFELSEEREAEIAALPESMAEQAASSGYDSVDEMLQAQFGPACNMEEYLLYTRTCALGYEYYVSEYNSIELTDEEIDAYFEANKDEYAENGITKESIISSVRHILVCPQGGTLAEDGVTTTYSEEEWAACLTKAEGILQEWKDGEATEASFADMVATYSEDPGSVSTGGLYEGITASSNYVENFLNWSIDTTRQPGDTGIVKTEYGYHIMYFVEGELQWYGKARLGLLEERRSAILESGKEAFPMKVRYAKIAIAEMDLS